MPSGLPNTQSKKPLLAVLRGERRDPVPMWMMRQAGRYLPEYRELRQEKGSFLNLVYDPDAAAEITLQPLKRFPQLDAAILFSDILIVPFAIGQNLTFITGEGPRLTPPLAGGGLEELTPYLARLDPIYETVRKLCRQSVDGCDLHDRRAGKPRPG
jgi:uroporphyrinogen decarboxylase